MSTPAWQVISWNTITATLKQFQSKVKLLRHHGTSIHYESRERFPGYGQVLWAADSDAGLIGLAWDWREIRGEVIAMADPMMVLTNLKLTTPDGSPMSTSDQILHFNMAIHGLRWQDALRAERKVHRAADRVTSHGHSRAHSRVSSELMAA